MRLQIVMIEVLHLHSSKLVCVMAAIDTRQIQKGAIVHTAPVKEPDCTLRLSCRNVTLLTGICIYVSLVNVFCLIIELESDSKHSDLGVNYFYILTYIK